MLLPSILQMLDHYPGQQRIAQKDGTNSLQRQEFILPENVSGLRKIELEIAAAAGLLRPLSVMPDPIMSPPASPSLEELIRAVSKFERPDEQHVVDVFE